MPLSSALLTINMLTLYKNSFKSKIGTICYIWKDNGLGVPTVVFLSNCKKSSEEYIEKLFRKFSGIDFINKRAPLIEDNILAYLGKKEQALNIEYQFLEGNDFEKKIWAVVSKIPYGKVASYREIAEKAGYPNAWRAVGTAIGHNPVMLIVPCHRVIKSSGEIGRYGGGENIKKLLLDLEANYVKKNE